MDSDKLDVLDARVAVGVIPALKHIGNRIRALTVFAACQLLLLTIAIGLLSIILVRML
jgi:hypothetical protein